MPGGPPEYLTALEWATEWGGAKEKSSAPFSKLPFHCCALTFQPFEDPVCTSDGVCYDVCAVVPYGASPFSLPSRLRVRKHKSHPVTGEPLELKDLIRLHFHKNSDGEYACPVLSKVFTESTRIVAIRTSGNVYCAQALEELCYKTKHLHDLLTDEPFTRKDVIVLQDPTSSGSRTVERFHHMREGLRPAPAAASNLSAHQSGDVARTLKQLGSDTGGAHPPTEADRRSLLAAVGGQPAGVVAASKPARDPPPGARPSAAAAGVVGGSRGGGSAPMRSSGACAAAFTSSAMPITPRNEAAVAAEAPLAAAKRKAYAALHTSLGDLNLELHADITPRAVQNFLLLAERGAYNGTVFHRSIKNFMIQGGDPTGTGRGGVSAWGAPFADEIAGRLSHDGRGVLSMANSGPKTQGSQFFVLFKSAPHLDKKHTIFGRVVGGVETTLSAMERVPTDKADRPVTDIVIKGVTIFDNPFADAAPAPEEAKAAAADGGDDTGGWFSNPGAVAQRLQPGSAVGAFLPRPSRKAAELPIEDPPPAKKAKAKGFGDFSGW